MDVIIVFKLGDNRGEQKRRGKTPKELKNICILSMVRGFFYIELYFKKERKKKERLFV